MIRFSPSSPGTIEDPHCENVDWSPLVNALKLLPKAHYNTLKYLAEHLHRYILYVSYVQVKVCLNIYNEVDSLLLH